ncbi:MAG: ribosome assembly RNA-binding protein YhbY [Lachnospiraceae bacterium]|nr:ribosome assembly RNA-binding protein YhbY [Lachnospiraceae bacterium]
MNNKQRSYLSGLASTENAIFQIGKSGLTPEVVAAVAEALDARELVKVSVLKNCADDPRDLGEMLAERTRSQVVRVIGRKIVLYKKAKKPKIVLPE